LCVRPRLASIRWQPELSYNITAREIRLLDAKIVERRAEFGPAVWTVLIGS
jgi:hypothetical protein